MSKENREPSVIKKSTETSNVHSDLLTNHTSFSKTKSMDSEKQLDATSYQQNTLEELIDLANGLMVQTPSTAVKHFNIIKKIFYDKYNDEKNQEEDSKKENSEFEFSKKHLIETIKNIENQIKLAQKEEKERVNLEKKKNFERRNDLLKQLEDLVNQDETLETINQVKDIQKEWKSIRILPNNGINDQWTQYHYLQNKFYDNHSINIELKELDRQKNLEYKIELTKKMESLIDEKSIKRCFIMLNKYHEEFRNTGPVPKESEEPIWLAFKKASDEIRLSKQAEIDAIENTKEDNLKQKEILLEKAILINAVTPKSSKEWADKTKQMDELFTEWKKIGPVPKANNEEVWINFSGNRNDFFSKKKLFYSEQNSLRKENLTAKENLCIKVDELKNSTDWAKTSKLIIQLQQEWKEIGPVPDKYNQAIWKKFRSACDFFFDAKNKANSGKIQLEKENLHKKEALIEELQTLAKSNEEHKTAFQLLKRINADWRSIGFVPHKKVKTISKAYESANNAVYNKFSKQIEDAKNANLKEHYEELVQTSNGDKALIKEEQNLNRKIQNIQEEITGLETNMSFFASSKTADKMLKDFELKISKNRKLIDALKKEITTLKQVRKNSQNSIVDNGVSNDQDG